MDLCLLARYFSEKIGMGIDRYTFNLVENIREIDNNININIISKPREGLLSNYIDKKLRTYLHKGKIDVTKFRKFIPREIFHHLAFFSNLSYEQIKLPGKVRKVKADIYHAVSPNNAPSLLITKKRPMITTFHDLIPLIFKRDFNIFQRNYFKYCYILARKSNEIICNSTSTKNDLIRILNVPEHKINVTYLGVDHNNFYPKKDKKENENIKIGYIGGLIRRKGIYTLIKAFYKLQKNRDDLLLLIGGGGVEEKNIKLLIESLSLEKRVRILGFLSQNNLNEFYNQCDLFVYPSEYEGFGFPVLEAMACKVPVITSNTSAIPEVIGDAGITINPINVNQLVETMKRIIDDEYLMKNIARKGYKRSFLFSWKKTARKTLDIYKKVL